MPSLPLLKYISINSSRWTPVITWVLRIAVGIIFIFSGFVKAIDTWGTLYKITDYADAWGFDIWPNLLKVGAFFLCAIEFLLGVFLVTGCFRRGSAILSFLFMCVMLPLTLWIALFNPVSDCGCFGDAVILSNWATFWKNVPLFLATLWLARFNIKIRCLITPALQWIAFIATATFIFAVELAGYDYQPLIDFRPYPIGSAIAGSENDTDLEYKFIYRKGDVVQEFDIDSLPDEEDGWEFIDRKLVGEEKENSKHSDGFHVWDGNEDVSDIVLNPEGKRLILLMPELGNVTIATTWKINSLHDWATAHNIDMIAAVSGSPHDIENWEDLSMPDYPIYTADDTAIKELVRGNPAVVFTEDGIVKWKSSLKAINVDDFMATDTSANPMSFATDNHKILLNASLVYLAAMALLITFSLLPNLGKLIFRKKAVE